MKFIQPIKFTDANLLSTNVANDAGVIQWTVGQTVVKDETRRYEAANKHWIVRALVAMTTSLANAPTGDKTDTNWVYMYDSNPYRMYDDSSSSQSSQANLISTKIAIFGNEFAINSAYALNVFGTHITFNLYDSENTLVYTNTQNLLVTDGINDWDLWLFSPIQRKRDIVLQNLPNYYLGTLELIINNPGGIAKCGMFGAGYLWNVGGTEYGARRGLRDFSVKDADEFGNYTITKRKKSKTVTVSSKVDNSQLDNTLDVLDELSSTGVVYLGADDLYREMTVFGFYKDAYAVLEKWGYTQMNFEIEELS